MKHLKYFGKLIHISCNLMYFLCFGNLVIKFLINAHKTFSQYSRSEALVKQSLMGIMGKVVLYLTN